MSGKRRDARIEPWIPAPAFAGASSYNRGNDGLDSRLRGNDGLLAMTDWIPAFAGMTDFVGAQFVIPAKAGIQTFLNIQKPRAKSSIPPKMRTCPRVPSS
jgi:hypothetical protein